MYDLMINSMDMADWLLTGPLMIALVGWLGKKIKHDIFERAVKAMPHIVAEVYEEYVAQLKAARPDGILPDEAKAARNMAIVKLKKMIFGLGIWQWVLFGGKERFEAVMKTALEGSLNLVRAANKKPEITTVNPPPLAPDA